LSRQATIANSKIITALIMNCNKKGLLVRLPYPYGKKQIYLPTDLHVVSARLSSAGVNTDVLDLNLHKLPPESTLSAYDFIGVGVFGSPYVPVARSFLDQVRPVRCPKLVGGIIAEKLTSNQFERLFPGSVQVANDYDLANAAGVSFASLASPFEVSIADQISKVDPIDLRDYLTREFGFFISQGCKFVCDFCAAQKKQPERYRTVEAISNDICGISNHAKRLGISKLRLYLSSLDLFQSPTSLSEVFEAFARNSKDTGIKYELRGLCRVDTFLRAMERMPHLRQLAIAAGLSTIGFGVDGSSEEIWRSQHKGKVGLSQADQALAICREIGITPELLMVMGFDQDTPTTLAKNYLYTISRSITHGSVSRPYLAKPFVPGNAGWSDPKYAATIELLLENPDLFTNLDFATLGSSLTHPDPIKRATSNLAYLAITLSLEPFGRNATYPLLPLSDNSTINRILAAVNALIPFDK
jgi:hypothetical protein